MPSWNLLELAKPEKIQLLASDFPKRADVYVCDNCRRDVTKNFRPRPSHSYSPYGAERFVCVCGQTYLSGAIEWDNIGPRERKRRVVDLLGIFFVFFFVLGIFGLPIGLIIYFTLHNLRMAFMVALSVMTIPAAVLPILEAVDIFRSIVRTRFRMLEN